MINIPHYAYPVYAELKKTNRYHLTNWSTPTEKKAVKFLYSNDIAKVIYKGRRLVIFAGKAGGKIKI